MFEEIGVSLNGLSPAPWASPTSALPETLAVEWVRPRR